MGSAVQRCRTSRSYFTYITSYIVGRNLSAKPPSCALFSVLSSSSHHCTYFSTTHCHEKVHNNDDVKKNGGLTHGINSGLCSLLYQLFTTAAIDDQHRPPRTRTLHVTVVT